MSLKHKSQLDHLIEGLASSPLSEMGTLAEGISRLQPKKRSFDAADDITVEKQLIHNSRDLLSRTYAFSQVYVDWPDQPPECDKYVMFQVIFEDTFSTVEVDSLIAKFRKFGSIFLQRAFLDGVQTIQDGGFTSPRDKTQPIHTGPTPADWNDYIQYFVIFAGGMTNYLPECQGSTGRLPRYVPFYAKRYEKAQNADGNWELGFSPVNTFCTRWTLEVNFNAKALNDGGLSDSVWVGSIVHEICHNGGWQHPLGYENRTQFMLAVEDLAKRLTT